MGSYSMQLWPLTVMNSETPETITVKAYIISIIKMLFFFFQLLDHELS